jgi:hypothetical protein
MDKSLDSVFYAEELLALFPDMLFLNVVRDPRAQISSMNKAIIHDFDTILNTLSWVKAYDKANEISEKYPEKVLTIRYEDFVSHQDVILSKICDFFQIDFSEEMLDIGKSEEASSISTRSALWVSNSSAPIPANVDKFKKSLTIDQIEIIETLAGKIMDRYGYERMTDADADVSEDALTEARNRSISNRQLAWKELRIKDPKDYMLRKYRSDYLEMIKMRLLREKDLLLQTA